jgi:ABC-type microcin C transport system permease subunit YejB
VLLHSSEAHRCIIVSLIGFLKESFAVAQLAPEGTLEKCIVGIATCSDFRTSPLAVICSASTSNWKEEFNQTQKNRYSTDCHRKKDE